MTTFIPSETDYFMKNIDGKNLRLLSKKVYESFDTSLLGLGDITIASKSIDTIAAVYDLEGFTNFCKQIEPHLSVPLFLSEFLSWLMEDIKKEMTRSTHSEGAQLWCPLPYLVKFMGDGLLVLWNVSESSDVHRRNIVLSAYQVCKHYRSRFFPAIRKKVVDPPAILRCGLARGGAFSVGEGNDFVGSCINMAARLQKISGATFAFNRRGFNLEEPKTADWFKKDLIVKQFSVRGIGDNELIVLLKAEYEAMTTKEKKAFKDL